MRRLIVTASLGMAVVTIISAFALYSASQFREADSPECAANPGWTVCSAASEDTFGSMILAVFLCLAAFSLYNFNYLEHPSETLEFGIVQND